ncbi:MAG: hypothetical protein J0M08_00690 [Bacteroidetes bacterium]|nr:hypothetical protein [Bacteroidota bacterium]
MLNKNYRISCAAFLLVLFCGCLPNEQTERQKKDAAKQKMDSLFAPIDSANISKSATE